MTWVLAKVVFNNKAMVYAGAGVCAVIGTLSPVCTAVISSCCGRHLTVPCYVLCIGGAYSLPMIASLSQRTASTSRFLWGFVLGRCDHCLLWCFGDLMGWGLFSPSPRVFVTSESSHGIFTTRDSTWDPLWGWGGQAQVQNHWGMPSCLVLADFGQLLHSCPPPGFLQGLIYAFASLSGRCAKIVILDYMMVPASEGKHLFPQ